MFGHNAGYDFSKRTYKVVDVGFRGCSVVKNPPANAVDAGLTPGVVKTSGKGNGNPLQYSCLENPMDTGAWQVQSVGPQRIRNK